MAFAMAGFFSNVSADSERAQVNGLQLPMVLFAPILVYSSKMVADGFVRPNSAPLVEDGCSCKWFCSQRVVSCKWFAISCFKTVRRRGANGSP
jgi:hypothetical protein